jgi:hypothetical protein
MKIIKYKTVTEVNYGTEKTPDIKQFFHDEERAWSEQDLEIAKRLAYNGEVTVEDAPDPETPDTPTGDDSIWEELDKAYQEGVDSV